MGKRKNPRKHKRRRIIFSALLFILLLGFLIPQQLVIPIENATAADWNPESFWYYPWGKSVTHKGVDIFAKEGTRLNSASSGIVIFEGDYGRGGNTVLILGPKWRLHYYAHLKDNHTHCMQYTSRGEQIGTVGKTGNASKTPAHLHYSIMTLIPYPWKIDRSRQGWKKMFYLNPIPYLNKDL